MLSPDLRREAEALVDRYPVGRSALLPLLHLVQSQDGMISEDGVAECAELLSLTKAEVGAVATFYTMYKRRPLGRHLVSVCTNFSCKVRGAQEVYDRVSERLGVGHNETTPDGAITLEHAECLGNCEGAPVVSVDYLNHECLTPEQALELVDRLIAGEVPPPTRGFPSPGIRAMSHRLAGLGPVTPRPGEVSVVDTAGTPKPGGGDEAERQGLRAQERAAAGDSASGPLHDGADKGLGIGSQATPGAAQAPEGLDTAQREAEKADAGAQVRSAGLSADDVEEESGYSARESPTNDPGSEERSSYPDADPRKQDLEADRPADDRDDSRLLTDRRAAPDGIADTPQSEELSRKQAIEEPGEGEGGLDTARYPGGDTTIRSGTGGGEDNDRDA